MDRPGKKGKLPYRSRDRIKPVSMDSDNENIDGKSRNTVNEVLTTRNKAFPVPVSRNSQCRVKAIRNGAKTDNMDRNNLKFAIRFRFKNHCVSLVQ